MALEVDIKPVRRYKKQVANTQKPIYTYKEGISLNYNITNVRAFCLGTEKCGGIIYLNPDIDNILEV
ncbi:MAG: hypothetical protein WD431_06990 [Cyclobacteriaceae bacterium]